MSHLRPLHESWTLRSADGTVRAAAEVPGSVHTDLLAAGLIPDPYLDDYETSLAWIGRRTWRYESVFDVEDLAHERADLVCEGLDTVATVELNGTVLGSVANMHRSYRFDARRALRRGENVLAVTFTSAYDYTEARKAELGERPGAYAEPYNLIRKMACNFGWDWGPTLVTAGIWRPIGLHSWSGARLASVRPLITLTEAGARVEVHVEAEWAGGTTELPLRASVAGATATATLSPGQSATVLTVEVPEPELWWPVGHGAQPLHELTVELGEEVWARRVGFRSVELDQTDGAFTLVVNGRPIFAKGVNWIPDDCFPHRSGYAERLGQAIEAGVNLIRVWGGGIYESDAFYDLCDELGLLVWQDFPFACAAYPEESPLREEVEAEARENVVRLASHPSLVLWCGNNENIWGYFDWDWQGPLAGRSWGAGYYLELLPGIVAELDPTRPYWPGSPYSGSMEIHPNDPSYGTMHIWDVWNQRDYVHYRDYRPRFASEFGFQGPPAHATLKRAIGELSVDSPLLLRHQKAIDGQLKLATGLQPHFPAPRDFDDWHYLTQLNQARAIQLGVEHFRSLWPYCAGVGVWQLNDCWPVVSWAAVDGDGRRKPMFHALRRAFADRLLTVQPREEGLALVAVNDTGEPWRTRAHAVRHGVDGRELAVRDLELTVPPRGALTLTLDEELAAPGDPARELLAIDAEGAGRAWWFFVPDKELALPAPRFEAGTRVVAEGVEVTVTAGVLLRDVAIFADRLDPDAEAGDQLVSLLPGESARFLIRTRRELDADALVRAPVLRCVNDVAGLS